MFKSHTRKDSKPKCRIGPPKRNRTSSESCGPTMIKAEITGPQKPLRIVASSPPSAPSKGLLVRTSHTGICHTDLHIIGDRVDLGGGNFINRSDPLKKRGLSHEGLVPGHEVSGVIESFGADAEPESFGLAIGDKVAVYPWFGCMKCGPCQAGCNNVCEDNEGGVMDMGIGPFYGGYSSHVPVPLLDFVVKVPAQIPMEVACLLPCSGCTAYSAVLKIRDAVEYGLKVHGEAHVLIIGAGGLGLWAIGLSKIVYKNMKLQITALDISQEKLNLAKRAGAEHGILCPTGLDKEEYIDIATNSGSRKYDAVIDFVGKGFTAEVALGCLSRCGMLMCIGLAGGQFTVPVPKFVPSSQTIKGSRTATLPVFRELVELMTENKFEYPNIEFFGLDEVNIALDKLREGKVKGRIVMRIGQGH